MTETLDTVLHDRPGEQTFSVTTGGEVVKPFLNPINRLVDEARLWIDEDGWHVTAADPANVAGITITLHADAFESYGVDGEVDYGLFVGTFKHHVNRARIHEDDTLFIEGYENQLDTTVRRETEVGSVTFENWMRTIDPDSVREDPDIKMSPSKYDFDTYSADLPIDVLDDTLGLLANEYEHVYVGARDGTLAMWNESKEKREYPDSGAVRFADIKTEAESAYSGYSADYLVDLIRGLKEAKVDYVNLWYGDEFPLFLEAERYIDDELAMELTYMMAPRIKSD